MTKPFPPEYKLCHSGTTQSPISLLSTQGLAHTHTPDFSGYTATSPTVTGTFNNWAFGPAYTLDHEGEDFSTLPALKFDDQTVHLTGWHIHFPSEHLVDGVRSQAEMHLVHTTPTGDAASVLGIRIQAATDPSAPPSPFFQQLPQPLIHFNDTTERTGVPLDMMLAVNEVGGVKDYWTYMGSLTTPPCSEGLRWFVAAHPLVVSQEQMVAMLEVSRFSHRVEQSVWLQSVNQ
jgi:carbonic anhydrase